MAVCTNLDTKGKIMYHMWIQFAAVFLSWTIQGVFCAENTTKGACGSCERSDLRAKHKLYNWLVLSIVLLLLILLLILVGFLCYRMWPRHHSAFDRAVFRYKSGTRAARFDGHVKLAYIARRARPVKGNRRGIQVVISDSKFTDIQIGKMEPLKIIIFKYQDILRCTVLYCNSEIPPGSDIDKYFID